jgi:hypothetical protein
MSKIEKIRKISFTLNLYFKALAKIFAIEIAN